MGTSLGELMVMNSVCRDYLICIDKVELRVDLLLLPQMCTNPQAYRIVSSSKERYRPTEILCLTTVILIVFCLFRQQN